MDRNNLDDLECNVLFITVELCMNSEVVNPYARGAQRLARQ